MNSGLGERMGTHESEVYNWAHSTLCGHVDFKKLREVAPNCSKEVIEAIRVLRRNVPEYRDVKVPGLDDV